MDKLKFVLFSIIVLSLLGLVAYLSVTTLQSGTEYKNSKKVEQLEKENKDLKDKVKELTDELGVLQSKLVVPMSTIVEKEPVGEEALVNKYQTLINELQKLINNNVFLKLKSKGPAVGTVQKFLNIYNKTSKKVDNDYGETTKTAVMAFQKAVGMTADGEAGPSTFSKMIEWLKDQK